MENNTETNAKSREMALNALENSPGWPIFCKRFSDLIEQQVDAKIFDPKTASSERDVLVSARLLLVTNYTPSKVLRSMLVQARSEVISLEAQKK